MARFRALGTTIVTVAALAACSGEKTADSGAATAAKPASGGVAAIDACGLLSAAEIEAAMGEGISSGSEGSENGGAEDEGRMTSCFWGTDAEPARFLTLQTYSWSDAVGAANYMETMRSTSASEMGVPATDVSGVGEEAFASGFGLVARKGAVNIVVKVDGVADTDEAQKTLANDALAHLP